MDDDFPAARPVQITVFPACPGVLLIQVREGVTGPLVLPALPLPLTKGSLAQAVGDAGIRAAVHESVPGRWTTAMAEARARDKAAQKGERAARLRRETEQRAAVLLGSVDSLERDRAATVKEKLAVDAEIAAMKPRVAEAKRLAAAGRAATLGATLGPQLLQKLNRQLADRQTRSQELQNRLASLRIAMKKRNREQAGAERADWARRFVEAAREQLDESTFQDLVDAADGEDDDDMQEAG